MDKARETGLRIFEEVYGPAAARGLEAYLKTDDFGVERARWSTDFVFGTVWSRDGIERKTRSAAVLGMMIALRQRDEIRYHTQMGIANGLTVKEIEEILYSAIPYCGLPAANVAKEAMQEALNKIKAAESASNA